MTAVMVARTYAEGKALLERYPQLGPAAVVSLRGYMRQLEGHAATVDRVYVSYPGGDWHSGDGSNRRKALSILRLYMRKNGSNGPVLEVGHLPAAIKAGKITRQTVYGWKEDRA